MDPNPGVHPQADFGGYPEWQIVAAPIPYHVHFLIAECSKKYGVFRLYRERGYIGFTESKAVL
jgi:hypothetical protein